MSVAIAKGTTNAVVQSSNSTRHLGIVGCGPRGLQCLEAISRKLSPLQRKNLRITIFETATHPGAGTIYDPTQPHVLRMNFATQHIDFWTVDVDHNTNRKSSLIGWLQRHYPNWAKSDQYIPRAVAGEYLSDCFKKVASRFATEQLNVVRRRVQSIEFYEHVWNLITEDAEHFHVDDVIVTTGHERLRPHAELIGLSDPAIFALPTQTNLSTHSVPSGTRVLIRGFGLTAIDAILTLTEGRGGQFVTASSVPAYIHGPDQPRSIEVHSRSGRPMLAKPTEAVEPITDSFWTPYRHRLQQLQTKHGSLHFYRDIWLVITDAASKLLNQRRRDIDDWYRGWSRYKIDRITVCEVMRESYDIALGKRPKNIAFALGEAWRKLYPQLVDLVSYGGLADGQWKIFKPTASEMERIAFGPPAESVGKLLSLIDAGLLRIGCVNADVGSVKLIAPQHPTPTFDHVIDAVIAAPHQHEHGGPLRRLIESGVVMLDEATGAVRTDTSGHPIDAPPGLAVFGRSTEGWVLGNDTLTRTMHPQIERWADNFAFNVVARPTSNHQPSILKIS